MNADETNSFINDKITIKDSFQTKQKALNNQFHYWKNMLTKLSITLVLIGVLVFACISQTKNFLTSADFYKAKEPIFNQTINCENRIINFNDYQDGRLLEIYAYIELSQFNFIYLYADWDAKSIHYKDLITQMACEFSDKITFHAINCFYGDCRKHFNLNKYPQFITHVKDVGSYAYKGPCEYKYLVNYFNLIQKPLNRIDSIEELFQLITTNERVIVGNFDFGNKFESETFKTFYQSSIQSIHSDFENPIIYGVVLNKTLFNQLKNFGPKNNHKILLFTSYGLQKSLKNLKGKNPETLFNWIKFNSNLSVQWYFPDKFQVKNEKNKLFIFVNRENLEEYDKVYSVVKYMLLKNYLTCTDPKKNDFLAKYFEFLELNKIQKVCQYDYFVNYKMRKYENLNRIIEFCENTDLFLIDLDLYHNYASNLIGENLDLKSSPITVLIDQKNQSIFQLKQHFSYKNLDRFIKNQTFSQNQRVRKIKQLNQVKKFHNIIEINGSDLERVLNDKNYLRNKDLLLFYFNNWCGFCRLVNFNLMNIMHKYFKHVPSFIILKVDVDSNDLKWNSYVNHLPTLIFMPATNLTWRDSVLFDYNTEFSNEKLVEFILFNAKNPDTISNFLINNFSKTKLHYDLIDLISLKLKKLESKDKLIKDKQNFYNLSHPYSVQFKSYHDEKLQANKLQIELLQNLISNN